MSKSSTVQQEQKAMIKELSGKVGYSDAVLRKLSLQQLKTIADNLNTIETAEKPTTKSTSSNIARSFLNQVLESEKTIISIDKAEDLINWLNIGNYFEVENGLPLPDNYTAFKTAKELDSLVSKNKKRTIEEQEDAWLKRAGAYIKSHVVGQKLEGSLFKDTDASHFFIEHGEDELKMVEKTK